MALEKAKPQKPTAAFIGASWLALLIGMGAYLIGLWNAKLELSEKGYYLAILLLGLFAAISVQKAVRDRTEKIPVTGIYYGIAWFCVVAALTLLAVGLWNSEMLLSEKGFYGVAMAMSLFAATAVQKNVRDLAAFATDEPEQTGPPRRPTPPAPIVTQQNL